MTNKVNIIFNGDIMLHSDYIRIAMEKGPSFVFEKISPLLKDADLRIGNLETVLSGKGDPKYNKLCLRGDESYIRTLKDTGFDVVSLANNHSFDYGLDAYYDSLLRIRETGIDVVGAGRNLGESRKMLFLTINGIRLGVLAYSSRTTNGHNYADDDTPGVAPLEKEYITEDIRKYKNDVDHLILLLHWGIEYSPYPAPDQLSLAHRFIDKGARLVIGHHPHILQGIEHYNDGLIAYSLGNLCDSDLYWEGPNRTYESKLKVADRESALLKIELSGTGIENVATIPLWLNDYGQPEICQGEKRDSIAAKLEERSNTIKIPDFENYWENMIIKKRIGSPIKTWWKEGNIIDKFKNFRFSQLKTVWELFLMYIQAKSSKDASKWFMFNPGNDKKPRPYCGKDEDIQ